MTIQTLRRSTGDGLAFLLLLLLLPTTPTQAQLPDTALLNAFEQTQGREQLEIARALKARLQQGRPSPAVQLRLIELVGQSQNLIKHGQVDMLYFLRPGRALDEPAIVATAAALASSARHNAGSAGQLEALLVDYNTAHTLPTAAMAHLYRTISQAAGMNAAYAVRVLQQIPVASPGSATNAAAIAAALSQDFPYTRETAAKALGVYGGQTALPDNAVAALTKAATTDAYIHIRIEAFTALATQDGANVPGLADALVNILASPDANLWDSSKGRSGHTTLKARAITLLMQFLAPPYQPAVVDVLVAQTSREHATTLPWLQAIATAQGLSPTQATALEAVALQIRQDQPRRQLYTLLAQTEPPLPQGSVLTDFQNSRSRQAQFRAAYQLERSYQGQAAPTPVVDAARQVVLASKDHEVRAIAARLIATADQPRAQRQQLLFQALAEHPGDTGTAAAWLAMYTDAEVQALTRDQLGNTSLPPWARQQMVSRLATLAAPGTQLQPATLAALIDTGAATRNYPLNTAVIAALQAWDASVPLSLRLANKQFLGAALFSIFAVLAVVFVLGSLANLAAALTTPLQGGGRVGPAAKRTGLLLLWLAISAAGLAVFALALVGFIGHNSAPDPRGSLMFNIPMYIAMVLFLVYTTLNIRWWRRRRAQQPGR